jgi:hypothetical protein
MAMSALPPPLVAVAAAPWRAAAALVPTTLHASTTTAQHHPMMPSGPLQPALVRALDQTQKEQEEAAAAAADQLLSAAQRASDDDDDDNTRARIVHPTPSPASGPSRAGDVAPISSAATAMTMTMTEALKDPPPGLRAPSPTPSSRSGGSAGSKKSKKKNKKSGGGNAPFAPASESLASSPRASGSPKGKVPRRHSAARDDEDTFEWEEATTTTAARAPDKNAAPPTLAGENPASEEPHLARAVRYAGVFLTPESRELLLACLPPTHSAFIRGDHVTLAYKPTSAELRALLPSLGRTVEVRVTGEARSSKLQAAAVELDPRAPLPATTSSAALHCTLSFAAGASAAEAGPVVHDAFLAAYDEVARERAQDASLKFVSLEEPLVLLGRVGVELEAFASSSSFDFSAASAAAGPSTPAAADSLGRKGDVIFSFEELARAAAASGASQPPNKTALAPAPRPPTGRTSMASFYLNGHHRNGGALVGGGGDDDDDDGEDGAGGSLSLVSSRAPAAAQTTAAAAPVAIPPTAEPAPPSPTTLLKQRYAALERAHGTSVCRAVLQACHGNLRDTVAELEGAALSSRSSSPPPEKEEDRHETDAALAREVARQLELQEKGQRDAQEAADAAHAAALAAETTTTTTATLAPPPPPTAAQMMIPPAAATSALNTVSSNNVRRKAEVVRALATAAGADPCAAVALLDLDPLAAPAVVVSALVECSGQADAAADALLSGRPPRYTSEQLMMMRGGSGGGCGPDGGGGAAPLAPSSYAAAAVPSSAASLVRTLAAAHPAVPEAMLVNVLEASGGDLAVATRLLVENEAAGGWQRVRASSGSGSSPRHRRASSPGALSSMAAAAAAMTGTMFPPLGQAQGQHQHHRGGRPWHSSGSSAGGSSSSSERASPRALASSSALLHPPSSAPHNARAYGSPTTTRPIPQQNLQQQQSLPRRPSSSSSSSPSGGGGNGANLGRSPPGSRSPPRGARGQGYQQQAAAIKAEVDRLYKEADMKQLEASVLERAAQLAPTKQDADRHAANRRAAHERAAALRREAGRLAADAHNTGKVNNMEVDVHGQSAAAALQCVRRMLESAGGLADASRADSKLKVIFGKGLHSGIEGPVLRPAVLELLARGGYEYEVPPYNPGVVFVTVRPGQAMSGAGPSSLLPL